MTRRYARRRLNPAFVWMLAAGVASWVLIGLGLRAVWSAIA